jgi:hypothetical protein
MILGNKCDMDEKRVISKEQGESCHNSGGHQLAELHLRGSCFTAAALRLYDCVHTRLELLCLFRI